MSERALAPWPGSSQPQHGLAKPPLRPSHYEANDDDSYDDLESLV